MSCEEGYTFKESVSNKTKLRGETGEKSQRPTGKTESLKTDRGTFKNKC